MTRPSTQDPERGEQHRVIRMLVGRGFSFGLLLVVTLALIVSACSSQYPTVVKIKLATVPMGDTVDVLSEPVRENQSLRFTWTVETRLERAQYLEWVATALGRQGFNVHERQERSLTLSKLDDGDAYRLSVVVTQEHPTRVQVTATVSPG
jgi:hypothetical protein